MRIGPDFPEAHELLEWYETTGHSQRFKLQTERAGPSTRSDGSDPSKFQYISDIHTSGIGSEKPELFTMRAMVRSIWSDKIEDVVYSACPNCAKKVTRSNNKWWCEKCQKNLEKPEYK